MDDCIFCKIITGEIPSVKVYEDDEVLAFLDAAPFSRGHSLVIPKKHFENIYEIDEESLKKVIVSSKNISVKIKNALSADGIRISQSNGVVAGQAVFHIHFHIIPRYQDDGLQFDEIGNERSPKAEIADLEKVAEEINR